MTDLMRLIWVIRCTFIVKPYCLTWREAWNYANTLYREREQFGTAMTPRDAFETDRDYW